MMENDGERVILTATWADIALAVSGHGSRNATAGEALANWEELPEETRGRLIRMCHETAEWMFNWEELLKAAVQEALQAAADPAGPEASGRHVPRLISSSGRLAIEQHGGTGGNYRPHSPRNDNEFAEGTWAEWVELAHTILSEDLANLTHLQGGKIQQEAEQEQEEAEQGEE